MWGGIETKYIVVLLGGIPYKDICHNNIRQSWVEIESHNREYKATLDVVRYTNL